MSKRNSLEQKRLRRAERDRRKAAGALPRRVDLIEWVRARGSFSRRTAERIILSGALRVDSHPVGYVLVGRGKDKAPIKLLRPIIDAEHAKRIQVVKPDILKETSDEAVLA